MTNRVIRSLGTTVAQHLESNCEEITSNADRDKIGIVITNLPSNAVKYAKNQPFYISCFSKNGEVTVSVGFLS